MQAFLSYSRRDAVLVETVVRDLDRARWSCWLDDALGGGETWWREILEQIRSCDVFIFALSAHSVRSRPAWPSWTTRSPSGFRCSRCRSATSARCG